MQIKDMRSEGIIINGELKIISPAFPMSNPSIIAETNTGYRIFLSEKDVAVIMAVVKKTKDA
jgi:hypothetical protein